jgi:hypothetical protein
VRKRLKELPNLWFFKASERSLAGIPDLILCLNGMFVGLELKRDEKSKASRLQSHTLELINKSGGIGLVVHPGNFAKVLNVLKILSEGGRYDRTNMGSDS